MQPQCPLLVISHMWYNFVQCKAWRLKAEPDEGPLQRVSSFLIMLSIEAITECKDLLNIFNRWDYPRIHKVGGSSSTRLQEWKMTLEKGEIPFTKKNTEDTSLWQKSPSPWNFSEVKFCFRMCHPNTLASRFSARL